MNSPKHTNLADGINFHYFNNIFLTQSHSQARVSFSFFLCVSHSQYFHLWGFDASQSLNVYDLLMLARIFIVAKSNIQYTTTINITVMRFTCYFIFLLLLFHHPELCAIWYSFSFSHSFMTVKVVDTLSHKMFASKIDDYSGLASFAYQFFFFFVVFFFFFWLRSDKTHVAMRPHFLALHRKILFCFFFLSSSFSVSSFVGMFVWISSNSWLFKW